MNDTTASVAFTGTPSRWINGKCLQSLIDMLECTENEVRGKEDMSDVWMPVR